jgi:hypothetical protein
MKKLRYSMIDVLMASPTEPFAPEGYEYQITRMRKGLNSLLNAPRPTVDDWNICCDALNIMETLVEMGVCQDPQGLIKDATAALEGANRRDPIRLDGPGIAALTALIEDYCEVIASAPARTMIIAHRRTEAKIDYLMKTMRDKSKKKAKA